VTQLQADLVVAKMSLTMRLALVEGVGEPRERASLADVRLLWMRELEQRRAASEVHAADR